jgi:hypothetical protein
MLENLLTQKKNEHRKADKILLFRWKMKKQTRESREMKKIEYNH